MDEWCARGSYHVGMRSSNTGDVIGCTTQKSVKEKARGRGMRPLDVSD